MAFDRHLIDVEDYLDCLEMRNVSKATEREYRFSCPYPQHMNGDENASAYMNAESSAFFCHGCKEKGDGVTLAAFTLEITTLEAIRMLRQRYQPGFIDPSSRSMREEIKKLLDSQQAQAAPVNLTFADEVLDDMDVDWAKVGRMRKLSPECFRYMLDRGFTPQTLIDWEFGYHERTDRITFAVRNEEGELIGVKGRAYQKGREPKYLVLGDVPEKPQRYGFSRYQTGLVVFGLHKAKEHNTCIICEGELNAVALHQAGYRNAVAVNGSNFTDQQKRLIIDNFEGATIFFDSDAAGNDGVWGHFNTAGEYRPGVVDKLHDFMTVRVVEDHEGDPASMVQDGNLDYLSELVTGAKSATRIALEQTLQ